MSIESAPQHVHSDAHLADYPDDPTPGNSRLDPTGPVQTGTVKWFNDQKGFGFITAGTDGKDVFVHHTVIEGSGFKTLSDGESVEYEVERGPKGFRAVRVKRSDESPALPSHRPPRPVPLHH